MNKKLRKGLTISTAAVGMGFLIPAMPAAAAPVSANGWTTVNGIQYFYRNGKKVMNEWAQDATGKWCFLSSVDGSKVQEGWAKDSTGWCYIRDGYWVDHATWAQDSTGWQFIGANGYWDASVAVQAENPIDNASEAVDKAEVSKLQADVDSAKALISSLNDALPEKAQFTTRINAVITNFQVNSITVNDAGHVSVVFSQSLDKSTAETTANYDFGDNLKVSKAEVQPDGKTVLITFADGNALTNDKDTGYIIKISGIKDSSSKEVDKYYKVLSLYDDESPSVESVKLADGGNLQIQFSEPVKGADETSIKITDDEGNDVDLTGNVEIDTDDPSIVNIYGLSATEKKDYTLTIGTGVKDLAGNRLTEYKTDFTVEKDTTLPTVESIQAVSLTTLKITFSEPINGDFDVYLDGDIADADIKAVSGTNKNSFYITFSDEKDDSDTYKLKISDYNDFAGNAGKDYTKFIKFSDDVPKLESVKGTIKTFNGSNYAVFTYDQDVSGCVHGGRISDASYTDSDGDDVDLDSDKIVIYDSSDDKLKSYLDDTEFAIALSSLEKGDYVVTLKSGFADVNDAESEETDIKFTVSDSDKTDGDVIVNGFKKGTTNNTYYVHFSSEVDSSALETDNYEVGGENIFGKASFTSSDKDEVKLTVKQGAIGNGDDEDLSSSYKFTTSGITDADGSDVADFDSHDTIDEDYYGKHNNDNFDGIEISDSTGPAVKGVKLVDLDTLKVTFDEQIENTDDIDSEDFQVVVDGSSAAIKDVDTSDGITFTLTLKDDIDDNYSKIKVGTSSDFDGKDEAGNTGVTNSTKTIYAD